MTSHIFHLDRGTSNCYAPPPPSQEKKLAKIQGKSNVISESVFSPPEIILPTHSFVWPSGLLSPPGSYQGSLSVWHYCCNYHIKFTLYTKFLAISEEKQRRLHFLSVSMPKMQYDITSPKTLKIPLPLYLRCVNHEPVCTPIYELCMYTDNFPFMG